MEQTIPQILRQVVREYPAAPSQFYKTPDGGWASVSYAEMLERAFDFGAGLMSIGIGRGAHVGLISDNRKEWLQADFGIMLIGAIDVPRGCDAIERDLRFILSVTECTTCVAENSAQFKKIVKFRDELPQLKEMILFDAPQQDDLESARAHNITLYTFDQIIEKGKAFRAAHPGAVEAELDKGRKEDIACIIFTSGTTGEPKGVILTHENFTLQLEELPERITIKPNQSCLSVLPVWHAYERACEYVVMIQGGALAYSKPIGSIMLADFVSINPTLFPAVPRVFEAVYQGVQRAMRKTGGVVYVLFKFFVASGNLHSKIDRRLFRKTARFGNDHIILSWILLFIPWLLLCPVKALGSVIVFKKVRAKLGNRFYGGI